MTRKDIEYLAVKTFPIYTIISALGGTEDDNRDKRYGFIKGFETCINLPKDNFSKFSDTEIIAKFNEILNKPDTESSKTLGMLLKWMRNKTS